MSTDLIEAPAHSTLSTPSVKPDGVGFTTENELAVALKAATLLSRSTLVPLIYQGENGLSNCAIALHMARRLSADPMMVMQNLHVIHGKPGWSSQFLIAMLKSSGLYTKIRYKFTGEKNTDTWGCIFCATEIESGDALEGAEVTIGMARKEGWFDKKGSKWQTMPELMLTYRAAAFFVRVYCPEIAMGLKTADEWEDVGELQIPVGDGASGGAAKAPALSPMELLKAQQAVSVASAATPSPTASPLVVESAPAPTPLIAKPITVEPGFATAEQVYRIEELQRLLGLDSSKMSEILKKRGVSVIRSLKEEQAHEIILRLGDLHAQRVAVAAAEIKPADEPSITGVGVTQIDVNARCTEEQVKAIKELLVELEQKKPNYINEFVTNLKAAGRELVADLSVAEADGLIAALEAGTINEFFATPF